MDSSILTTVTLHEDRQLYVIVIISWAQGMYGIYCTEARGHLRPRVEVNKCCMPYILSAHSLYPVNNYNSDQV